MCLTPENMNLFLEMTGLGIDVVGTTIRLLSEFPTDWIWNGETFCMVDGEGS